MIQPNEPCCALFDCCLFALERVFFLLAQEVSLLGVELPTLLLAELLLHENLVQLALDRRHVLNRACESHCKLILSNLEALQNQHTSKNVDRFFEVLEALADGAVVLLELAVLPLRLDDRLVLGADRRPQRVRRLSLQRGGAKMKANNPKLVTDALNRTSFLVVA